ncbi:hypothetical protein MGN70_012187 [Eutypa lata]|nr:hypothetical protein MGN70_012187 [Eutypa lata]
MPPGRKPKYYKFYDKIDDVESLDQETLERIYNSANSRFYSEARKDTSLGSPATYAEKKRTDGTTLLEAVSEIVWLWRYDHPRRPVPRDLRTSLEKHYGITITVASKGQPEELEAGGFFHRQFDWVTKS